MFRLDLTPYGRLAQYIKLTDKLIDDASKDAVAQAARLLAIRVAQYERKFGDLPQEAAMDVLETETLDEKQAGWVADGLERLAVALATIKDDEVPETLQ